MTPLENSSSPYNKDIVPPIDGSSSLIAKMMFVKPPPVVRRMMLFENDDVMWLTLHSAALVTVEHSWLWR